MDCRTEATTNQFEHSDGEDDKPVEAQESEERQLHSQENACFPPRVSADGGHHRIQATQARPDHGLVESPPNHGLWRVVGSSARYYKKYFLGPSRNICAGGGGVSQNMTIYGQSL